MLTDFILHYFMFCISRSFIFTSGFSEDLFSCLLLHFSKQLWFWSSRMHLNRTSMNVSVLINCFPGLFIFFLVIYFLSECQQSCHLFSTQLFFCLWSVSYSMIPWYEFVLLLVGVKSDIIWCFFFFFLHCLVSISLSMVVFTAYYKILFQKHHKIHIMNAKFSYLSLPWSPHQTLSIILIYELKLNWINFT